MFNKRNNIIQRLLTNPIILSFIGLIIIVLISIPLAKNVSQRYRTNKEIANLQKEIYDQENKKLLGKEALSYMQSDQYVKDKARLNLGYGEPGEQLVVIQKQDDIDNKDSINGTTGNANSSSNISNAAKWIKYFFQK